MQVVNVSWSWPSTFSLFEHVILAKALYSVYNIQKFIGYVPMTAGVKVASLDLPKRYTDDITSFNRGCYWRPVMYCSTKV